MTEKSRTRRLSRRTFIGAAAVAVASPAIIGRASVATAATSFAGESLIVVPWSGNYETVFKETVVAPFNAQYGTKVESQGGWDQMVPQILAAPADNPPFDISITEESVTTQGLNEKLWLKTDPATVPNLAAVYPYFAESRPDASQYGVPFAGGTCMLMVRKKLGMPADSWSLLWDPKLAGKTTLDGSSWWWSLSVPALMGGTNHSLDAMFTMATAESLFAQLDKLKVGRWYMSGTEEAAVINQGEADAAMTYSSDAFTFIQDSPDEYLITVPKEGTSAWTDWFMKVRGTKHSALADLFLNYMLEKATQDRFLAKSLVFMSRKDVTVPAHWKGYPTSNEDFHRMFQLITMKGWESINKEYQAFDDRMKLAISRSKG